MRINDIELKDINNSWEQYDGVFLPHFLTSFLQWQLNDMVRGKKIITMVSLTINSELIKSNGHSVELLFTRLLQNQVRNNDYIFASDKPNKWIVILVYAGIKEVQLFINRIHSLFKSQINLEQDSGYLVTAVLEIQDGRVSVETILNEMHYLEEISLLADSKIEYKVLLNRNENKILKVAIIDYNEITHTVLRNLFLSLNIPHTSFDIAYFTNGEDYLSSQIYLSSNLQLVLISDILPERDGLEILQQLRQLPNETKYFVIVLGSRNTEEDIIFSLEHGADDYVAKPFNVNLLAVKIKRMLERGI